MFKAQN